MYSLKIIDSQTKEEDILALANRELQQIVSDVKLQIEAVETLPCFEGSGYFFKIANDKTKLRYWLDWTEELGAWIEPSGRLATILVKASSLTNSEPIEPSLVTCLTSHIAATCLCLQGQIAIHANVVTIHNKAIAFAGDSGKGKSTLTAFCVGRGAGFVTDDVLVLDKKGVAKFGSSRIKLYPSTAAELGLEIASDGDYKVHYDPKLLGADASAGIHPVETLYILEESNDSSIYSEELSFGESITHLIRHSYHSSVVIQDYPSLFDAYIDLAQKIRVKKLFYPRQLDLLPEVYRYLQNN